MPRFAPSLHLPPRTQKNESFLARRLNSAWSRRRAVAASCFGRESSLQGFAVFRGIHRFPFALDDSSANLSRRFAFMSLLVAVEILIDAGAAAGAVFACETIEQTRVAFAPVAVAIAGLLVKRLLDLRGDGVGVLHQEIRKAFRIHGFGQLAFGSLGMVGRDIVGGFGGRGVLLLRRSGSCR